MLFFSIYFPLLHPSSHLSAVEASQETSEIITLVEALQEKASEFREPTLDDISVSSESFNEDPLPEDVELLSDPKQLATELTLVCGCAN